MGKTTPFRRWVRRNLRCWICGAPSPDPHHLKAKGMGGRKDEAAFDVNNVVALCRGCHTTGHAIGWEKFLTRWGEDEASMKRHAIRTWERWLDEPNPEEYVEPGDMPE